MSDNDSLPRAGIDIGDLRTGKPSAVFFAKDPHVDTLMRSSLINGFDVRVGGRVAEDEMFPYMDMVLHDLLDQTSEVQQADQHMLEVARGSSQAQERLIEAVIDYRREVETFKRNRMLHPHNLFRAFEEDDISHVLVHTNKNAVSFQVQSMSELDTALDDWEDGTLSDKMAEVFLHTPMYAILLLGGWNADGQPTGLVMVVCQLTAKAETLLDKYLHPADDTIKLLHLGPDSNIENDDAFFDDLSPLENTPNRNCIAAGRPSITKLRLWQSIQKGPHHGGAIVALQAWYGESYSLTSGIRGSRSGAQFFVDILFEKGEHIREISGYFHHGEYGHIQIETSKGEVHSVGLRQAGHFFQVAIPGDDGFEVTAFVGAASKTGGLQTLKLLVCHADHFTALPDLHAALGDSCDVSGFTAQGSRRRVLPDPDAARQPSTGSAGGRQSTPGHLSASDNSALAAGSPASGSAPARARRRPWSSQGRQSPGPPRQGWADASGAEGLAERARPHSVAARGSRAEGSGGFGAAATVHSASLAGSPLQAATLGRSLPGAMPELEETQSGPLDWRRAVAEAVKGGAVTAQTRLILQVEYCTAERPSRSLRGSAQQYVQVVADLQDKCRTLLWEYNVRVIGNSKFERWCSERDMLTVPVKARIGACEVSLSWQHRLTPCTVPLHSKLSRGKWPHIDAICQDLRALLPAQYHDIRFMAHSASDNVVPSNVKVTITRADAADPLGLVGTESVAHTDEDGVAAVSLPAGRYRVNMQHPQLEEATIDYAVEDPGNGHYRPFQRVVMQPRLRPDQVAISLSWTAQPSDLDLYVVTPTTKVSHQRQADTWVRCSLDLDVRTGYGPETVTLQRPSAEELETIEGLGVGTMCHVFVHQYSEDGELAESEAEIRLSTGVGVNHVVRAPLEGVGQYWDAFSLDLKTMEVTERGVISAQEPSFDIMLDGKALVQSDGEELGKASSGHKDGRSKVMNSISTQRHRSSKLMHDFQDYSGVR